jgi:VanZ family protein
MKWNASMKLRIVRWGPAVLVMILIFIASAIPSSELPQLGGCDVEIKKGAHMLGYALLTTAYLYALDNGKHKRPVQFIIAICLMILYAVSDEYHQSFTPGRSPSAWDVLIDACGGLIGLASWYWIRPHFGAFSKSAKP